MDGADEVVLRIFGINAGGLPAVAISYWHKLLVQFHGPQYSKPEGAQYDSIDKQTQTQLVQGYRLTITRRSEPTATV